MRTCGFAWASILVLTGAVQALSTVDAFRDGGWGEQTRSELLGRVGPWIEGLASVPGPSEGRPGQIRRGMIRWGPLEPWLEVYLDSATEQAGHLAASWAEEIGPISEDRTALPGAADDPTGPLGGDLSSTLVGDVGLWQGADYPWTADVDPYSDAAPPLADGRIDLSAFAEIDWTLTGLQTEQENLIMATIVFPALGAMTLMCCVLLTVAWLRRRRAYRRVRQLLDV